jgi:hypothetical protein
VTSHQQIQLFLIAVSGSLAGLFWPLLVGLWRKETAQLYRALNIDPGTVAGVGARKSRRGVPGIVRWLRFLALAIVIPIARIGARAIWLVVLAICVATIAVLVGFAAFLKDPDMQAKLGNLGIIAYLAVFNYGFTAASIVGEAFKNVPPTVLHAPTPEAKKPDGAKDSLSDASRKSA